VREWELSTFFFPTARHTRPFVEHTAMAMLGALGFMVHTYHDHEVVGRRFVT